MSVDQDRRPGRFLLTGSANVLLLPQISESLAGRMELITLWPLSQGKLQVRQKRFLDGVFSEILPLLRDSETFDLKSAVLAGAYPEVIQRVKGKRRDACFAAYITALLQCDVHDLAKIDGLTDMPRLISLQAARVGGLLNMSKLSRSSGIPNSTLKRCLSLLQAIFLFQPLPAWSSNLGKRLVKSPKIHLIDSGLTAHLAGITHQSLDRYPVFFRLQYTNAGSSATNDATRGRYLNASSMKPVERTFRAGRYQCSPARLKALRVRCKRIYRHVQRRPGSRCTR